MPKGAEQGGTRRVGSEEWTARLALPSVFSILYLARGCSSTVEHLPSKQDVGSSNLLARSPVSTGIGFGP